MRVQAAQVRTAGLAAAAALLAVGVTGCSGGSSSAAPVTPHVGVTTDGPSATPSGTAATSAAPQTQLTIDPSAVLAAKQAQVGCKAALGPLFDAVVNTTSTQDKVLSVTPAAAKPTIQLAFTQLNALLSQDPNALVDGQASKAAKVIDDFCATPAGAQFVGTTPAVALKPPKPVKTTPPPKPTTHR